MSPAQRLSKKKKHRKPFSRKVVFDCSVRTRRLEYGLSIRDVAEQIGMTISGIHSIEHGTDPQLSTAYKLAAFFGAKIDDLWSMKKKH